MVIRLVILVVSKEVVVPVNVKWKGGTVAEAKVREFVLLMDAPLHEKKEGEKSVGPSATETFLVAIGRCQLISILKAAKALGVDITDVSVDVKMRDRKVEPGVWSFEEVTLHVKIDAEAKKRELGEVVRLSHKYCAVGNAVREGLLNLEWEKA